MVSQSALKRSSVPHPDPVEASARQHELLGQTMMQDCVADYLHNIETGAPSNELVTLLYRSWIAMDCPGLVDSAVVAILNENQLYETWMSHSQ